MGISFLTSQWRWPELRLGSNPVTVARVYGKALEKLVRYSEAPLVIVSRSNSQSLSEWGW